MKKVLLISIVALAISGCQLRNQDSATAVGVAAGGLLGNTIGKGSTRTAATIAGAAIGGMVGSKVGESMDRQEQQGSRPPLTPVYGDCGLYLSNKGAFEACKRGMQDRKTEEQMLLEAEAYEKGRGKY